MPKTETRERGLYKNGSRWWLRVKSPLTDRVTARSTGTTDLGFANDIARMLRTFSERRDMWEWVDAAESGAVALGTLYDYHASGSLHLLRAKLETAESTRDDVDLSPWVAKWEKEHVAAMHNVSERHKDIYVRQVRAYIPEGAPFPRSGLTDDYVKATTLALTHPQRGTPLSDSTKRQYADSLARFCRYARRRVPLATDPFDDAEEWLPRANSARSTYWDYPVTREVLDAMVGEPKVIMTLILGSGMELGAALALQGHHIGATLEDGRGMVVAPGTKNAHRENRTIFVDAWAWPTVKEHARRVLPKASLWQTLDPARRGADVRGAFYAAQVVCDLIAKPELSESGKRLWHSVNPHTIHDARHTWMVTRVLGLDGEPRQDLKYCSMNLGHADETMGMRIYSKMNLKERLRMIELREAREAGKREGREASNG